ncbi:MAG: HlyD family type I secretion periplasmic adaptor subunit [Beijerinckiaceae bacterium]
MLSDTPPTPAPRLRRPMRAAGIMVGVFVVGFGTWAWYAPLESAAIASGTIEVESSRKTVQHLEGGIINQIVVKEGADVKVGDVLVRLDDTKARAALQILQAQLREAQSREARLLAERNGSPQLAFPQALEDDAKNDAALADVMAGQRKIFDTRRELIQTRVSIFRQRIAQTEREIAGLRAKEGSVVKRAAIVKEEVGVVREMVNKGLERRPRLLALEREQVDIDGRYGEAVAQIARAQQSIGETQAEIVKVSSDFQTEVAQSLRETQAQIAQVHERLQAAQDVLARTEVRATDAGVVTDLKIYTTGGVVTAGQPLMDIVPRADLLIVRAQIKPDDIDLVRNGLPASVRLLPFKQRRVPPVDGVISSVSADRLVDKRTEQSFFSAKVKLDEAKLRALEDVEVLPGMPVEVLVKTGRTTAAQYALAPLLDSFNRAFREK